MSVCLCVNEPTDLRLKVDAATAAAVAGEVNVDMHCVFLVSRLRVEK